MTRPGERRLILALGLVAGACIYAFVRVFSGGNWILPVAGAAALAIVLTRWLRHLFVPRPLDLALMLVAGTLFVFVTVFPSATLAALPGLPVHTALSALRAAQAATSQVTAPIDPGPGYLALAVAVAWLAGWLSALLLGASSRVRPEGRGPVPVTVALAAPLPWVVLFAAGSGIGRGGGRVLHAALFLASLLVFVLAEQWSTRAALARVDGAVRIGLVAMAGALLLPALVPGYQSGALLPWAGRGNSTIWTVNPLVQIKPLLLDQNTGPLFRVTAAGAGNVAYLRWRLTSLELFDGNTWAPRNNSYGSANLQYQASPGVPAVTIRQSYQIDGLRGTWLPAAHLAVQFSGVAASVDSRTESAIVDQLKGGEQYSVLSKEAVPSQQELRAAGTGSAPDPVDLALPPATRAEIGPIAAQIVGNAAPGYAQAMAVQDYLRTFTYSTSVSAGTSTDYLYTFLKITKTGYCEQFAGSMAALLRALGIPARVAVGFLPGQASPVPGASGQTSFLVSGKDAHAWPEAWFKGIGWVAFEPTPRSDAAAPPYAPAVAPAAPNPAPTQAAPAPVTTPVPAPAVSAQPRVAPAPAPQPVGRVPGHRGSPVALIGLAVLAALGALFGAREIRLRAPGWRARTKEARARADYREFLARAADAGGRALARGSGETEEEYAQRVVGALRLPAREVEALTAAYQQSVYGPPGGDEAGLGGASGAIGVLRGQFWRRAGWRGRIRLIASPRPLFARPQVSAFRSGRYAPKPVRVPRSRSAPSAARRV